jgi:hypothetical protein
MKQSGRLQMLERIFNETIPMRGRMIHGKDSSGKLYEQPQDYDIHGRVFTLRLPPIIETKTRFRQYLQSIEEGSTKNS